MVYTNRELKEIQKIQVTILNKISKLCNNNNISFFLIGGTVLGAKRHSGFIPWDDDIDIAMTRENYNKFISIAEKKLSSDLTLQTVQTERKSPYMYTKIRKNNTMFMEYSNRNLEINHGIYIDVFPYDNVPNDPDDRKKQFKQVQFLLKLFYYKQCPDVSTPNVNVLKKILRKALHKICKIFPLKILVQLLEKYMTMYNQLDTEYMACLLFPQYMIEYGSKSTLFPLKDIEFEGFNFPAPNNIEKYLNNHYGDYNKLPPLEKRIGHKPFKISF